MLGSSGVGKSTLVNALVGSERQRTGAVREDDSRGRHTTTHRELVRLPGGALLIDTPGIRSLGVAGRRDGLDAAFADIADLALALPVQRLPARGRARLRGPGGARRRHGSPPTGSRAIASSSGRRPTSPARPIPSLRAEERRKWRAIHVSVNQHMKRKYGSDR